LDYQVSARKYRPGTFDDVIGQSHVVQTLQNAIVSKRIAHAFLFSGTRGVGKTTVARILAKALNCEQGPTAMPCTTCANCVEIAQGTSVDVVEIDGASNTSVDDVREIRENVKFTPFRGQYRVYIIDEVHMLSNSAFNALLKTLEEPPGHVVFIFATTEIHKIPATILSRCQHYNFRRISKAEIVDRLRHVSVQDGLSIDDRSLMALARASEGSMRDALSLLDQVIAFGGKAIRHSDLEALLGTVPQERVRAMIEAVMAQDSRQALQVIADLLDQGHDLRAYCADLVEYVRNMLVAAVVPVGEDLRGLIEATDEDVLQLTQDARSLTIEHVQELFRIFTAAEDALRSSAHPRFLLESAVVRATRLSAPPEKAAAPSVPASDSERASRFQPAPPPLPAAGGSSPRPEQAKPRTPFAASDGTMGAEPDKRPAAQKPAAAMRQASDVRSATPTPPAVPTKSTSAEPIAATNAEVSAEQSSDCEPIELRWDRFQEEVTANHPNIAPFLEMGTLVGVEGALVTLAFPKQATVARAMLEKEDNLRTLSALAERLYGRAIRVRVVEATAENQIAAPTMKQIRQAKEQEQRLVMFQRAKAHPLVKQALEMFGGELIDVRNVTPAQEVQE
jgi:DNA polymerase-3 subunit gamma/tau